LRDSSLFRIARSKILRRSEAARLVETAKAHGRRVVFTNGVFDILHVGHVRYLEAARSLGDMLVVGLNTDEGVKRFKGPDRPIVSQFERAEVLAALECVDVIVLFGERLPTRLIVALKPSVHVKGGDYALDDLPEAPAVVRNGGEVRTIPYDATSTAGLSTSGLIDKIIRSK